VFDELPFRHASAVFIPWSDATAIALYQGGGPLGWRLQDDPCIGIQRHPDAPVLSRGNKPAGRCPASRPGRSARSGPGGWTATALPRSPRALAPGIPIIDVGTGPNQGVEGPGQATGATQIEPSD
jgi:hypothetical protein